MAPHLARSRYHSVGLYQVYCKKPLSALEWRKKPFVETGELASFGIAILATIGRKPCLSTFVCVGAKYRLFLLMMPMSHAVRHSLHSRRPKLPEILNLANRDEMFAMCINGFPLRILLVEYFFLE